VYYFTSSQLHQICNGEIDGVFFTLVHWSTTDGEPPLAVTIFFPSSRLYCALDAPNICLDGRLCMVGDYLKYTNIQAQGLSTPNVPGDVVPAGDPFKTRFTWSCKDLDEVEIADVSLIMQGFMQEAKSQHGNASSRADFMRLVQKICGKAPGVIPDGFPGEGSTQPSFHGGP